MNLVLSGPSGAGKGTIISRFLEKNTDFKKAVSFTTRNIRAGEKDGIDYYFVTKEVFLEMEKTRYFFETVEYDNNLYGIPYNNLTNFNHELNINLVYDLVISSGLNLKAEFADTILIYVLPKNIEVLNARRGNRGSQRYEIGQKEIRYVDKYDYFIKNINVEKSVKELEEIVNLSKTNSIFKNYEFINNFYNVTNQTKKQKVFQKVNG